MVEKNLKKSQLEICRKLEILFQTIKIKLKSEKKKLK